MTKVRLACRDDLPSIVAISNWAAEHTAANFAIEPETLQSWVESFEATHERLPWLVATGDDDDQPVRGFARASPWKGRCAYLFSVEVTVYVEAGHHRQGIGRALYEVLIDLLDNQGYRSLMGGVTLPNDASVALHEAFGFRKVAEFERVGWKFGRWHSVGYFQRLRGTAYEPPQPIKCVAEVADLVRRR